MSADAPERTKNAAAAAPRIDTRSKWLQLGTALWLSHSCCRHTRGGSKTPTTRTDAGLTIRQPSRSVLSLCFKVAGAPASAEHRSYAHSTRSPRHRGDILIRTRCYILVRLAESQSRCACTHLRDRGCPGSRPTAPPLLHGNLWNRHQTYGASLYIGARRDAADQPADHESRQGSILPGCHRYAAIAHKPVSKNACEGVPRSTAWRSCRAR